ncbi:MAG: CRISPR-associated endoribonuclease Cas6 [Hydrogenobaculum sp.]|nr:MAG: CRISPR-associated endoribonuclease Cas6 [Hydrogenobaculum sp.]
MRALIRFEAQNIASLPVDFRGGFIGFFKDIFGYKNYVNMEFKPYVFSVYFGKEANIVKRHIENVRFINLRVSSEDDELVKFICDRTIELSESGKSFRFGNGYFYAFSIELIEENIRNPFVALSPIVVSKDKNYLTPFDEGFEEALLESVEKRYEAIRGKKPNLKNFSFIPKAVKTESVLHYKGFIKCFRGEFLLEGNDDIIEFIYKNGLGYRTAQGFGFIETK